MQKTNALQLRQNMGAIIKKLKMTGDPILLKKGREPVAVIISLEDFQKRFVDVEADLKRREIVEQIKRSTIKLPKGKTSMDLIDEVRS